MAQRGQNRKVIRVVGTCRGREPVGVGSAVRYIPDFRAHVIETDVFTPRTIRKFTGHLKGAVYGATQKVLDGRTPIDHLYLCGTDQGFLGIIGSMLSGITMANNHLLR